MRSLLKSALLASALVTGMVAVVPERAETQGTGRIGPSYTLPGIGKPIRVVRGRFTSDVTFTSDTFWVLRGAVFIGEPARLTIQAGTTIIGETATRGTMVIERGAQIIADGTAQQPIVFTSDQPVGQRGRGDWGGLVINGRARLNVPTGESIGEGSTGVYGGTNNQDSSGVLRFVRVEYAGIEFSPDNELNGIAFQGVGNGTIVDSIQVHFNKDDGIEMFGGSVDIKRAVLTGIGDDNIDWTNGWVGRLQFAVVQQRGDDTDQGIEADNNGSNHNLLPRSNPTIFNLTMIGDPSQEFGPESTNCMRLRVGTAATIRNFICQGFKQHGIDVRDAAALPLIASGELVTTNGIVFQNLAAWGTSAQSTALRNLVAATISEVDPMLVAPFNRTAPDWRPLPGSPALTLPFVIAPSDGFFEFAAFLGALGPDLETDWTRGWTNYAAR
jgi:hypothetical protein